MKFGFAVIFLFVLLVAIQAGERRRHVDQATGALAGKEPSGQQSGPSDSAGVADNMQELGKCKQGAKTYSVKDEWDDADGKHWYRCDYNVKQNKAFITKGCIGYSKLTRPRYFKEPEKLKKLRFNANEYFKLSRKSTYLCAPDGLGVRACCKVKCTLDEVEAMCD